MVNHSDQKQFIEESLFLLVTLKSHSIAEGRNSRQKLKLLTGSFPTVCSACFLLNLRTIPPTANWTLQYPSFIKKMPHKLAHWWGTLLTEVPNDSTFSVNKNKKR